MSTTTPQSAAPQTAGLMCESVADTGAHGPPAGNSLHTLPKGNSLHSLPKGNSLHSLPKGKGPGRIRRALAAGLIALTAGSTMGIAATATPAAAYATTNLVTPATTTPTTSTFPAATGTTTSAKAEIATAPAATPAGSAATTPAADAAAGLGEQANKYLGVAVEVKNRSHTKVIYVKDRHSGKVTMIPGGHSAHWSEAHTSAGDEVELASYYDHRVDGPGVELDGANAKGWWPTFSVNGDVENFSTDEMKVFNPGDGGRYVVTRISDSGDHKRFVVEVTPPGPIEDQAPAQSASTLGGAAIAPAQKPTPKPEETPAPAPVAPAIAPAPAPVAPAIAPAAKPAAPAIAPAATDAVTRHAGAMAANHAPTAPNAPAAPAAQPTAQAPESQNPEFFNTRGTHVGVGNGGDQPIWIQKWYPSGGWGNVYKLNPGEWTSHSGDYPVLDDVEMRVYFSEADAQSESNNIDIDAENPAATTPWMSVDWDSEYFGVGGKHTWITDEGHRFDGERHADSKHNIEFRLLITPR